MRKKSKILIFLSGAICTVLTMVLIFTSLKRDAEIPVSRMDQTRKYVTVSGEAFGIRLYSDGIIIVGVDQNCSTDLYVGDVIKAIDGRRVTRNSDLKTAVSNSRGKPIELLIERNKDKLVRTLTPVCDSSDGRYKIGLFIRDSTAGIGTITFYDPEKKTFAGLGHGVCDIDTGEIMPLFGGDAVKAEVKDIYKARPSEVGELCGVFTEEVIGPLLKNTDFGIFGSATGEEISGITLPVAMNYEVEKGKAKIITTINGTVPKAYDVKITKIHKMSQGTKSLSIKVTDKELLDKTGGIIQGMSGSPIVQNGMLVGAITHVLCDDPARGYAIFAETTVNEE